MIFNKEIRRKMFTVRGSDQDFEIGDYFIKNGKRRNMMFSDLSLVQANVYLDKLLNDNIARDRKARLSNRTGVLESWIT